MTPLLQVQQAYLHLCWAIKLDSYLRLHPPAHKVNFDNPQSITDPADTCWLLGEQFDTINDILLGAENSILLSVGNLFIALDSACKEAGIKNNPFHQDSFGQLRSLIYMCRCAFAHNILAPHWMVKTNYRRILKINLPDINLTIDINELAGKPFEIMQIGGYSQLMKIIDYIILVLAHEKSK